VPPVCNKPQFVLLCRAEVVKAGGRFLDYDGKYGGLNETLSTLVVQWGGFPLDNGIVLLFFNVSADGDEKL
jgi:hypothetical protein